VKAILRSTVTGATFLLAALSAGAQDIQERVIKFGHLNNPDHPVSMGVKRFAELVAAKSGGKLKVQEFPSNQLGNEMQQQSALQGGVQEMSAPATTSLAGIVKEFGLIDFPFAVGNFAQADALLDGPFGQALIARLPEKGLMALGYWDLGFRNVTNSKRPITRPEDLDGYAANIVLVSKRFGDRLSPAEQRIMNDAAAEARGYQRQVSRAAAQTAVADLQAKGMQFNAVSATEQARMRDIAKPVTEKFAASYDSAIVKLYNAELAKVRQ